ncbi:MAG: hypothetical protein ACR2OZ_01750 [Verrucomicrobiales bacterium]
MKLLLLLVSVAAAISLSGCQSGPITDSTINEGPLFGKKDETRFVVGTDTGEVNLGDLAKIAKTVRKYKSLNASEQEIIRRVAALKLDGYVAVEMKRLAPRFEPRITAVRQRKAQKIQKIAEVRPAPLAQVAQEIKAVLAEADHAIGVIDSEWRAAATASVTRKYGTDFAVAVNTRDNKPVVALASLRESGVVVASAAYELSGSQAQLSTAARQGARISHEGRDVVLLDTAATLQ